MMRTMFTNPKPPPAVTLASLIPSSLEITENFADLVDYLSNCSDDSNDESGDEGSIIDDERHSH